MNTNTTNVVERVGVTDRIEEALRLLEIAMDFRQSGSADNARRYARRALAIFEREAIVDHPDVVRILLCLAGARADLADYARAEADYRRANEILDHLDDALGDHEVDRLRIQAQRGLANAIRPVGRQPEAEALLKEALAMAERTLGTAHPEVACVLNDLGVYYRHTGAYEESSRLHLRALSMTEHTLGAEHPQTAAILHELGVLERVRGHLAAAEPFARRSVDIREKAFGPDSPQVAAECLAVARLLEGQEKYPEAESMYRRALTILERRFGPDHHEVAIPSSHLARLFSHSNDAFDQPTGPGGQARCA